MKKTPARLKRWIVTLAIAGVVGLVLSIAGAWASAKWAEFNTYASDERLPDSEAKWPDYLQAHFPPAVQASKRRWLDGFNSIGVDVKTIYSEKSNPAFNMGRQVAEYPGGTLIDTVYEFGWPFRCLSYESPGCIAPSSMPNLALLEASRDVGYRRGIEMLFSKGDWRRLPVTPLLMGLVSNTFIFGGLTWLLLVGPKAIRKWNRQRNGRCRECAYPIGVSPVCTECGEPIPMQRSTKSATTSET